MLIKIKVPNIPFKENARDLVAKGSELISKGINKLVNTPMK